MTRCSLISSAIALGLMTVLGVIVPLSDVTLLSALATFALAAAFWDHGASRLDRFLRGFCSSSAAGLAVWLMILSGFKAQPTGFALAAMFIIAVRLIWTVRSGKVTGPPALASPT